MEVLVQDEGLDESYDEHEARKHVAPPRLDAVVLGEVDQLSVR